MELWIRSQDKSNLKKVNNIYVEEITKDYDSWVGNIYSQPYVITSDEGNLGFYATKERALEVLDEIQNMIKPTLITTQYHSEIKQGVDKLSFDVIMQPVEDKITYIQPDTVIYEMPEE